MDDLTVDDLDDLAGYAQSVLRGQDWLSQDLRANCLSQLRPAMRQTPEAKITGSSLGPI